MNLFWRHVNALVRGVVSDHLLEIYHPTLYHEFVLGGECGLIEIM